MKIHPRQYSSKFMDTVLTEFNIVWHIICHQSHMMGYLILNYKYCTVGLPDAAVDPRLLFDRRYL